VDWIICFRNSPNFGLWRLFTFWRPDFGHVFAVRYVPELDAWQRFECASERFIFETLFEDDAVWLIHHLIHECTCIEVEGLDSPIQMPGIMYCVSFVKHLVGIRNPFILTPYQLYCELLKREHKFIFNI